MPGYFHYWGKAQPSAVGGSQYHLLPYHCLDVAAVMVEHLVRNQRLLRFFSQSLSLKPDDVLNLFAYLAALHDPGKWAVTFQAQRPDVLGLLQSGRVTSKAYTVRHDTLGAWLWLDADVFRPIRRNVFGRNFEAAEKLIFAVTGHHGQPPDTISNFALSAHFDPVDIHSAAAFARDAAQLLLPQSTRDAWTALDEDRVLVAARQVSWWLAGLTVLADWIGSNTEWFKYQDQLPTDGKLDVYWQAARQTAKRALDEAGLAHIPSAVSTDFPQLFPSITTPTPLQKKAESLPLQSGPQLLVLEDVTGAGKTEAALMLAHRLLAAGEADGLYFALPTQATADQMYERLADAYDRLFDAGALRPSLVLAHGARDLSQTFRASVMQAAEDEGDLRQEDETAGGRCTAWLADKRKAALLAHVGVGTIDQALSAVLYTRHQSLRLLGLHRKVLVVDEVHACDTYMLTLLEGLLRIHRRAGGSAILLSATLPQATRERLCAIYGAAAPQKEDFPLLTQSGSAGLVESELDTRPDVARTVKVVGLGSVQEAADYALFHARKGKSVAWVRNTVGDAIKAYRQLSEMHDDVLLFHARFALGDRLRIQNEVLNRLGKRQSDRRCGLIVVTTQVFQESLDADADEMISDLAPIDLLIQRAGRLHRHCRRGDGQLLPPGERDSRGGPTLAVLGPEPIADADHRWLGGELSGTPRVYPNVGQLWLGARMLRDRGGWQMPGDARHLIEGVYGPDAAHRMPEALRRIDTAHLGAQSASRSAGLMAQLNFPAGYAVDGGAPVNWWEDSVAMTRLGEASVTLHLLRWQNGALTDFWPDSDPQRAAALSRVSVREALINAEAKALSPEIDAALNVWREAHRRAARWVIPVPMTSDGGQNWTGNAMREGEGEGQLRRRTVRYHPAQGLEIE